MSFSATPPPTAPNPPPPPPLPPPPDIMPEASSNIGSLVRKKLALISISPPSTASTPKRRYQQISEDNEMAVDTPPPKVIKISVGGMILGWDVVCGCKVNYRIDRIESECYRVSYGKPTTIDVPFSREHINFDCPCGCRCEISMNVKRPRVTKKNKKMR
ncbi:hypothetical protein MKW98_028258 [Papaver atlanticum]|uniref:Uncharacterized protein n=1 Tax=Papaver atlanticum TaxID=357466 RepID=A0AAD4SVX7_9MAGN|nr:hypothetical protein MKW98_028258 [Papaver atlanticum]